MTTVSNLALPLAVKTKTDPHGKNRQPDRLAFGEALQATKTGKRAPEEKTTVQSDPHWRAPARLTVAIAAVERASTRQSQEFLAPAESPKIDLPDDATLTRDDEPGDVPPAAVEKPEPATSALLPPISAAVFQHPAFAIRRGGDKPDAGPQPLGKALDDHDAVLAADADDPPAPDTTPAKISVGVERAASPAAAPAPGASETPAQPLAAAVEPQAAPMEPTSPEPVEAKPAAARPAIVIVIEQSTTVLAPANTVANLAEKLAAQATLIFAPAKAELLTPPAGPPAPVQAHSLKLQLHPAELGMVTASLRFAGEQLTIELQVETAEAHRRLSADSETIVKTLRGLGYEIDRVTILQPAAAPPALSRSDPDPSLAGQSRGDPQTSGSSGSNDGGDRLDRRNWGQGEPATPDGNRGPAGKPEDRAGGGIYI